MKLTYSNFQSSYGDAEALVQVSVDGFGHLSLVGYVLLEEPVFELEGGPLHPLFVCVLCLLG